jgi:predicted O-linked N-acetylglucosamine transferase (SPINDLY family)
MGNFEIESPALRDSQSITSSSPADDIAASLDILLTGPTSSVIAPEHDIQIRLQEIPFETFLSAIDRARPALTDAAEVALYQHWIAANPQAPLAWAGWFNLGTLFARIGNRADAATAYGNALLLRPDMHCTAVNLGLLLEAMGQPEQALATWHRATQPDEARVALQIQQGRLLEKLGLFEDAERMLRRVLLTDPTQPDVVHHWVHLRQKTCLWPVAPSDIPGLPAETLVHSSGPLGILALTDDIALQSAAAAAWVSRKTEPAPRRLAPEKPYPHARIRIGYMSSDFCSHAMSYLITELFERHDRTRFEIFGYCSSHEDGTSLRQRVLAAFDHYRVIRTLSDEAAAQLIRDDEIDVLIDLNGITDGSRLAVLRWRPAPIQATYLGFIGPVPMPELDYLLADDMVIPPEYTAAYQPRPLAIAQIYQANDSKRTLGRKISRAEAGLPEDRFVLCCFTKHFKITEEMFAAWMRILQQAERAMLWLAIDNQYSQANLIAAAKRAGIAEERIIFSERADPDLYMSRLGLADLFLDTFPYNAGTVASDALRMGLPLLTLCGKAFASRMAASLLHAVGASQGITTSLEKYVETATRLANTPAEYAAYKKLFTVEAWSRTIGNIVRFTQEFEDTWSRVVRTMRDTGALPALPERERPMDTSLDQTLAEAIAHHQAGRMDEAERLYRIIMASPAAPAAASFSFALLCTAQNRLQEAIDAYCRAIAIQPDFSNAYVNLGTLVLNLGQREEAVALLRRAIAISPENAMAHGNLGMALQNLHRLDEAFAAYRAALTLQPDNAAILMNFGAALMEQKSWNDSITVTQRAIALQPDSALAYANLGTAYLNLGQYDDALNACHQAMALKLHGPAIHSSLGGAMLELGQPHAALTLCRAAIAQDPALPNAWFNLSHACKALNQLDEATQAARQAIALSPDNAEYHFHLAHTLLLQGEFDSGWAEYEWRWKLPDFAAIDLLRRSFSQPQWTGESLKRKTILVYTEQGLGDIIQFARYLPLLVRKAANVIVAVHAPMRRLLSTIEGITLVSILEPLPAFDLHCPLMSLPLAFATKPDTIPAQIPYLHTNAEAQTQWAKRIGGGNKLRVSIVWAGNPAVQRDRFRSPRLASVAPLFNIPGIEFVILQMGQGREDLRTTPLPSNALDLGTEITDLADTAAIMSGLDLVISSCTGPLHLAGALGVPCWAIIPFAPHFPWLLERTDTLWYPSMRLYRQHQPGRDWTHTITQITTDLQALAHAKAATAGELVG